MMNTAEVAEQLGTTTRQLRAFLRSPISTFVAVGSGARYDFNLKDMPTIEKRFEEWKRKGKPKQPAPIKAKNTKPARTPAHTVRDEEVWAEEGPVVIEDIRDPRVRARVRRAAEAAEQDLNIRLMNAGLHISQLGDRKAS